MSSPEKVESSSGDTSAWYGYSGYQQQQQQNGTFPKEK